MDNKVLLIKSIMLLYRESLLRSDTNNSKELVRGVLDSIKSSKIGLGISGDEEVIDSLKNTILEMCSNDSDYVYIKDDFLQTLKLNTNGNTKLYEIVYEGVNTDFSEGGLKRSILNTKKIILNHFKEQQVNVILNKASYEFKYNREKIENVMKFVREIIAQLEPLSMSSSTKDPAVIDDIDLGDEVGMIDVLKTIKKATTGSSVYKTGWKKLNKMLQGGFRPGMTMICALQHKYKTGFSLTLFKQLALYNRPQTIDKEKKPLLLRISFEDDLDLNIQFLYQSLMYDEKREDVNLTNVNIEEMGRYIKNRLQVNGFHIKLLRVNPTQWTYMSICNKIIELESQGYNVEVLMLDYLSKIPTTGCNGGGITGADVCDLFSRMRNFCSPKKICLITPHQLSSEAKQLIRNGINEEYFVREISEKGYTEKSRALDQVVDLELYIHKYKKNNETFLAIQRGKHRIPTIIPEDDKFFLLKFPKKMPIPDDLNSPEEEMFDI